MLSKIERYLQEVDFTKFLEELGLADIEVLVRNVDYFTEKEAAKRDEIVQDYFGEVGTNIIVNEIASNLLSLPRASTVLDAGAGTGFFTTRIADRLSGLDLDFYALDATPAMLTFLAKKLYRLKKGSVTPVLGVAERIKESLNISRRAYDSLGTTLPTHFDALISVLMLHHCKNPPEVFSSMRKVMKNGGRLTLIDLCEHDFNEFREEMGDVHLGFDQDYIISELSKRFEVEEVKKMPRACTCKSTGRSADLFIASVHAV